MGIVEQMIGIVIGFLAGFVIVSLALPAYIRWQKKRIDDLFK